jgi:thiol:disulfide interchange protein DsbD
MKKRGAVPILLLLPGILTLFSFDARPSSRPSSPETPLKRVRLLVLDAGNPGLVKLGLHIELQAGWHLYWVNPGDAGLAPSVRWTLPAGFAAGPLRHPVPARSVEDGILSFEHRDEVLLLCDIAPPSAGCPVGPWKAAAVLEWMACRESCVTGETAVEAVFPPVPASLAEGRSLFGKFARRFPRPFSGSGLTAGAARAEWTGSAWRVEVTLSGPRAAEATEFFAYPVEDFVVDNSGVTCLAGKIVCPLIPSRGPGAPPPPAVAGILVIGGIGYEISVAVPVAARGPVSSPAEADPPGLYPPGLILIASWR